MRKGISPEGCNTKPGITNSKIDLQVNKHFVLKNADVPDSIPGCYGTSDNTGNFGCWTCIFESPCTKISKWDK